MPEPILTAARTPRHALPYLFAGQAQKEAFVNEALSRLDALVQPAVLGEASAPPAAPSSGGSYIVGPAASGAWAGHEGQIATWIDTQWLFAVPTAGMRIHDVATGSLAVFDDADGWRHAASPGLPTGGAVVDVEARAAIAAIVARLHSLRIFSA